MTSERLTVHGVPLAYREAGSGRAALLVHGNFASSRWFGEQLRAPPAGWRLLAPDLPNFGASGAMPEAISMAAYARYLAGFIDRLDLSPVALVGHSLGGAVAQAFAASRPHDIRGLLLISSAPPGGLITPEEHYPFLEMLHDNPELMGQALAPTMPSRRPPYFPELVQDALAMRPAAFSGNARALERLAPAATFQDAPYPVLVLHGGQDELIGEALAASTAAAFPAGRLEHWAEVGHSPQIEDPQRFNTLLTEFLEGLS